MTRIRAGNQLSGDARTLGFGSGASLVETDGDVEVSLGGSLPFVTSGVTRDAASRITGYTIGGVAFTVGYDVSTGLASTITAGGVTRTIGRDASGLVTGVS